MRRASLMIVVLMIIGCDEANGGGDISTTPSVTYPVNTSEYVRLEEDENTVPIEINLDDMTFSSAFHIEHLAKGEGHTFWWNGAEYTTDLYISTGNYKWVRNSNDLDDHCYSNKWDECGECNGPGMKTWYMDLDGDGLGDPANYTRNCIYPSVDEE